MGTLMLFFPAHVCACADGGGRKIIAIYGIVQQAENLAGTGETRQALARMTEAQAQLQQFQKLFPRGIQGSSLTGLDDLTKKIAG